MDRKQKILALEQQGYNIEVTGRHVNVTDAIKAYAIEKISKLERIASRIIDVHVTMDIQKLVHTVDIVMKYGHTIFKSYGTSTDMYASIDMAVKRLEGQVRKYLERLHHHHGKRAETSEIEEIVYGPAVLEEELSTEDEVNEAIERENSAKSVPFMHEIVRQDKQPLKLLTDEEAIFKMDASDAPVLVYKDEVSRKLKVIYRRQDGNYGVIQPE